jgi:hypothetical protein
LPAVPNTIPFILCIDEKVGRNEGKRGVELPAALKERRTTRREDHDEVDVAAESLILAGERASVANTRHGRVLLSYRLGPFSNGCLNRVLRRLMARNKPIRDVRFLTTPPRALDLFLPG